MFKKTLQVATAFGLLLAGYAVYVRAFALFARVVAPPMRGMVFIDKDRPVGVSKTARQARALARAAFGPNHWASAEDLPIRIYNADRHFWLYARDYERLDDGKTMVFRPFAVIWQSNDGRSLKTATSDVAKVDLDQPLGLVNKPGTSNSMKVVHARIEGNCKLRDDKGTPDKADDLVIHRLTYAEYDEPTLKIESESDVEITESDRTRITGTGILIKLREREDGPPGVPSSGFSGAKTAYLKKNVHIFMRDVGPSGILPGNPGNPVEAAARPVGLAAKPGTARAQAPTPLDLRCDGLMQVDLPKPHIVPIVGPPAPQGPTIAQFFRNVEVLRGPADLAQRDSLTCDHLRLILVPNDKPKPVEALAASPAAPTADDPPLEFATIGPDGQLVTTQTATGGTGDTASNLTLRRAEASGHNVRLVSAGQGVKARCNELIHKKQLPDAPDETYFRGDATTKLVVEKEDRATEGPDKGKVTGYTLIRTVDATIFDDGRGNENATIVARGPGELESRAGPDKPIERTARWLDQLTLQSEPTPAGKPGQVPLKRITLTGRPAFADLTSSSSIDARRVLVVKLAPKAKGAAQVVRPGAPDMKAAGAAYEIRTLVALGDVQLKSPGRTLTARDRLDAEFETPIPTVVVDARDRPAPTAIPTPASTAASKPEASKPGEGNPPRTPAADRPVEPEARAVANRVWARVRLKPAKGPTVASNAQAKPAAPTGLFGSGGAGGEQAEIDQVFLRGAVSVHQDPGAGKTKGTDVTGEAVDVFNNGNGTSRFIVFDRDPAAAGAKDALKPEEKQPRADGDSFDEVVAGALNPIDPFAKLARIDSEDITIRGEVIGLDQGTDYAWVDGLGSMTQLASRGLLSDRSGPSGEKGEPGAGVGEKTRVAQKPKADRDLKPRDLKAPAPVEKTPMTITFAKGMKFFGRSTDPSNRPAGHAEFYKDVHAWTDDASLDCGEVMKLYLDRVVKLARPLSDPKAAKDEGDRPKADEPRADVALIECVKDVVVVNLKRDPETRAILQKQRIVGDQLTYEKATGRFFVPGEGEVFLYEREGQSSGTIPGAGKPKPGATSNRVIRQTSGPVRDLETPEAVVGSNESRVHPDLRAARPKKKPAPLPPLVLTQIHFTREMRGRFGSGKVNDTQESRWADFFGNVEVLRAKVADAESVLDPDDRPADSQSITAQTLRVVSEPLNDPKKPDAPPRYLMRAWENAFAASEDKTIQADTITYDSLFNLFYAYGEDGKDVILAQQDKFGQPASITPMRAAMFNAENGQSQAIDPKSVALVNTRTGQRPYAVKPPKDESKVKRPPRAQFRNLRGNIERKDFTGR